MTQIETLHAHDRDEELLVMIRGGRTSGTFAWYRWALRKIVQLRLTHLVGPLRACYEEVGSHWVRESPRSSAFEVLQAIQRLGGPLSEEERALLASAGRLRE